MKERNPDDYVINYKVLRRGVGILGIILPVILVLGSFLLFDCKEIYHSISYYYHTGVRNIFVAILAILAFFLYSYKGPNLIDNVLSRIAAILAIIIALFPTRANKNLETIISNSSGVNEELISVFQSCERVALYDHRAFQVVHLIAAALFLLVLALMSWMLFTRTDPQIPMTDQKKWRNKIYRICAIIIVACVLICGLIFFIDTELIYAWYNPIFWLESLALWAFGLSWLVKGEAFLAD